MQTVGGKRQNAPRLGQLLSDREQTIFFDDGAPLLRIVELILDHAFENVHFLEEVADLKFVLEVLVRLSYESVLLAALVAATASHLKSQKEAAVRLDIPRVIRLRFFLNANAALGKVSLFTLFVRASREQVGHNK